MVIMYIVLAVEKKTIKKEHPISKTGSTEAFKQTNISTKSATPETKKSKPSKISFDILSASSILSFF